VYVTIKVLESCSADPACLLCDPGEAAGERGDADQRLLHHRELQGLHHAAGLGHQAHRAEEDGGHAAGEGVNHRRRRGNAMYTVGLHDMRKRCDVR